jgi:small conductance mechanosensitive channel
MSPLIQEIQQSLLELFGSGIKALPGLVMAIIILLLTRSFAKQSRKILKRTLERIIQPPSLRALFTQLSYVTIWVLGALIAGVTVFPSLRIGDILALLGLGSVAIGVVFQDLGKNLVAGILLLLQEPFHINDQVIVENYEGTIEEIGFRATQILTYQGERVLLPNAMLFSQPVKVCTAHPYRRTDLTISVDYTTSLSQASQILLETLIPVEGVLSEPAPTVDVGNFGDSSIELIVRYWTLARQIDVIRTKTRVLIALKETMDESGIIIPYPQQVTYLYNQKTFNGRSPIADSTENS